jgi:hypothetical protein
MKSIAFALAVMFSGSAASAESAAASPSTVRGDFDGDGVMDQATLIQHQRHVTLTVRLGSASSPETFEFRVDPAAQDAICTLPAKLSTSASFCSPMDEPLSGCKELPGKADLSIRCYSPVLGSGRKAYGLVASMTANNSFKPKPLRGSA